jgi:hypothetical protein
MMNEQRNKVIQYAVVVSTILNLGMCLNLYLQLGRMQYQVAQIDSDISSAVEALSRYIWEIKNNEVSNSETYPGGLQ